MSVTMLNTDMLLLKTQGWIAVKSVVPPELLATLQNDLDLVYEKRRKIQIANGIGEVMSGTCHHLLGENTSLDDFFISLPLDNHIKSFFDGNYILNSYGAFINRPHDTAYVSKVHRDVRTFAGDFKLMLNMLVMLDDFTLENGATYVLSGSHNLPEKPDDNSFYQNAARMTGKAGDIVLFDSNLWHAAGENRSPNNRRGLTLTYSRPFFKQQLDYVAFLGDAYIQQLSEAAKQVIGYHARVPKRIEEYYVPVEQRFYKPGQG